jgi:hypothetical protein
MMVSAVQKNKVVKVITLPFWGRIKISNTMAREGYLERKPAGKQNLGGGEQVKWLSVGRAL